VEIYNKNNVPFKAGIIGLYKESVPNETSLCHGEL
jgi:hypothetical protein